MVRQEGSRVEATYDKQADAVTVTLVPDVDRAKTARVGHGVLLHFDAGDRLIELELLKASSKYPPTVLERLGSPVEYLTIREAARESGLGTSTLRIQIGKGKLHATKRGHDWFVTRADLYTYLDNRAPSGRPARRRKARRQSPAA